MLIMKLAAAGLLGMVAISALAQAPPMNTFDSTRAGLDNGDRDSLPRSHRASNIVPANTSGTSALSAGHTGEARQSLEMAETRAPGGSDSSDQAKPPSGKPQVAEIRDALHAQGNGDRAHAIQIIDIALRN
jgi:hypothetical protein